MVKKTHWTSVFRTFEGHNNCIPKKLDLIALLFIKLYYNENFEIDFLELAILAMGKVSNY